MSFSYGNKAKISDKMETVSMDEVIRRLGPEGCRDWAEKGLMERIEVLEAENRALKKQNAEFEDKNQSLRRKNTESEDKQAKMAKSRTDD